MPYYIIYNADLCGLACDPHGIGKLFSLRYTSMLLLFVQTLHSQLGDHLFSKMQCKATRILSAAGTIGSFHFVSLLE